jgi:hypothetical protein
MKETLLAVLFAMICITVFSQTENSKQRDFQFTFLYPLGTNGVESSKYENKVSVNVLAGISRSEKVFTFGGLANIILHDAAGIQFAGLYNHIGNDGGGFLLSGLVNSTNGKYDGSQIAGLVNRVKGNYNGLQLAGLANHVGENYAGLQFAGLMNCVKGNYIGIQFAGLTNISRNISGAQISGLLNIAKKAKGMQLAGLVNVADSSNCPIALINLIKNGEKSIAITYGETGSMIVSFRSGGKVTYGIVGLGYNHEINNKLFVTESGLGVHVNFSSRLRINNELKCENSILSKYNTFKSGYYLLADYKLAHLSVFAGPSIGYMYSNDINNADMFTGISLWKKIDLSKLKQAFIGYQFGIQYIF